MRCRWVKKNMSAYIDGESSGADREAIDEHLKTCRGCRAELEALKSSVAFVGGLPEIEPTAGFEAAFRRKLRASEPAPAPAAPWIERILGTPYLRPALAATALLVLAVGVFLKSGPTALDPGEGEIRIVMDLELLRDYALIDNLELLENLDVIQGLEEPLG